MGFASLYPSYKTVGPKELSRLLLSGPISAGTEPMAAVRRLRCLQWRTSSGGGRQRERNRNRRIEPIPPRP
jgi:hypothetical protein